MMRRLKKIDSYQVAIFLSSLSLAFGIFREFLIVALFGFTARNDELQLYLSIFYTIGLTIDSMRLSCLNLYSTLSLSRIVFAASLVTLPFCVAIGFIMSYATGGLAISLLILTIIGGYLNLITAVLITYKQRSDLFLVAQLINVMPNIILIPGILISYVLMHDYLTAAIILMTSLTPAIQCLLLLLISHTIKPLPVQVSLWASSLIFIRHLFSMIGEQLFQIITRSVFYKYGAGYLSVYAIGIRIYSAARFILIDSFIGSKLANWQNISQREHYYLSKMINLRLVGMIVLVASLFFSLHTSHDLFYSSMQMSLLLICGFYFSTLVRVIYFKINHYETNAGLVMRFGLFELIFAMLSLVLTQQLNYPILALLWIGYIAKPFMQLLLLRKRYQGLVMI